MGLTWSSGESIFQAPTTDIGLSVVKLKSLASLTGKEAREKLGLGPRRIDP